MCNFAAKIVRGYMQNIRNIAIIAHVDHGKTTLVDKMLMAGHLFRDNQTTGELMLDHNDLECERGTTILSKKVSINYSYKQIIIVHYSYNSTSIRLKNNH